MSLFLAADACLSWSLPSITEQQVFPHRLPMQYWMKNHWPDEAPFKHSLHTTCISNSAILCNNYISLLSDLCTCIHVKEKWHCKRSHSSSLSSSNHLVRLQTWEKVMGWCSAQWKTLLFCVKTIVKESHKFELARHKKKKKKKKKQKEKHFWPSGDFLVWYFCCFLATLGVLFVMKTLKDER